MRLTSTTSKVKDEDTQEVSNKFKDKEREEDKKGDKVHPDRQEDI